MIKRDTKINKIKAKGLSIVRLKAEIKDVNISFFKTLMRRRDLLVLELAMFNVQYQMGLLDCSFTSPNLDVLNH